ncbi:NRAMP family divalent metal transporter [Microvirga lotononidis]|uniref:Mn2+/Fe2_transporter, NRAMP family n=1 Tax=Microvirga lotononidis TaxID=864069 RepID=I4Z3I0_9HYPH|nr:divalent metal cation transporter [Microvirga lotononidis]EIM30772.1 Mn2+/Fe2_ transporter, NRAMP family [Microvirga lotononidis]WQO31726.1 divalent metal cation transporter [Microvirga lotononidis]
MHQKLREPFDTREQGHPPQKGGLFRVLGSGIITGAADDDPSAIGTYASAGAKFGLGFLWIAPVLLPMMYVVVYLSAKLGQVYGKGLFAIIRDQFPRWVLYPTMIGAFIGNIIEAAADLGGIGAAMNLLIPLPVPVLVAGTAAVIFALQYFGSYSTIRKIFRWLALILFAYVVAAILAKPDPVEVLIGTVIPRIQFNIEFLSIVVACIGTSLSAYVYTWQSNQEVEEEILKGRRHLWQRKGATNVEIERTRRDVLTGMIFSNVILYFIILATGSTLHASGQTQIETAAQAATALEPLAGPAAKWLFAAGIIGVGFLAVPIMTTGAAYDIVQGFGKKGSLHAKPSENKFFYATIGVVTALAVGLNFLGFNPMRALVWSGIVQGFSVPPLLFMMMLLANDRKVMGERVNGRFTNILGWATTGITFLATVCLVVTWFL